MKAEVLARFRDKHTDEIHEVGKILNITMERFDEILSVGKFVKAVEKRKNAKKAE